MSLRSRLKCQPHLPAADTQSPHLRLRMEASQLHPQNQKPENINRRKGRTSAPGPGRRGSRESGRGPVRQRLRVHKAGSGCCLPGLHPTGPPNLTCAVDHVSAACKLGRGGSQLYFPPLSVILPELLTASFHNFLCTHHWFSSKLPCRPLKLSSVMSP